MRLRVACTKRLALALLLLTPAPALAELGRPTALPTALVQAALPDPATTRALTLDEALALGEKNNLDLQAARARLRGAHSDVERALSALLPTVSAQGKFTFNYPEVSFDLSQILGASGASMGTGMSASLPSAPVTITPQTQLDALITANIPLIVPSAYPALKGARAGYRAQEKQLAVTAAQLLQSVATAFFAAAGSEELVTARRHAIEVAQKTLDTVRVRLSAGVINRVEVTRAELALVQAQQRVLEAQDTRAAAYRTLGTLLQISADGLRVGTIEAPAAEPPGEQQLIEQALHQRPEVARVQETANAADAQVRATWLRLAPTLTGFGNLRLTNATGFGGRADYYAAGLQLDWLLFDGFARDSQRHTAEAQKLEAELTLSQLRSTITDEVYNGRRSVLTRQQGLIAARRSVQMAKETLDLVRIQYESGTGTQLDLLTSQDQLVVAEVGLAQARFDLALSAINLRRLTGSPLADAAQPR